LLVGVKEVNTVDGAIRGEIDEQLITDAMVSTWACFA
jgi:hypothetical protein